MESRRFILVPYGTYQSLLKADCNESVSRTSQCNKKGKNKIKSKNKSLKSNHHINQPINNHKAVSDDQELNENNADINSENEGNVPKNSWNLKSEDNEKLILQLIPKMYHKKVFKIFDLLSSGSNKIQWNAKGELIILSKKGHKLIKGSHIGHILRKLVTKSVPPIIGWSAFIKILKQLNIPSCLYDQTTFNLLDRFCSKLPPKWIYLK